jgi:predicted ATPase
MRRAIEAVRQQKVLTFLDLGSIALAEAEARAGDPERAVALLDEALATDERACCRTFEAELQRVRGEILLKRNPGVPRQAEDAFLAAIAVAKHQGARSFELRAALPLAKLYSSTSRPAEAKAVLGSVLEGFPLTLRFPEMREALDFFTAAEPNA